MARKLNLSESQITKITCREVVRYAIFSLKRTIGLTQETKDKVVKTRGNTTAFELLDLAMSEFDKYDAIVERVISMETFDKEIAKAGKTR